MLNTYLTSHAIVFSLRNTLNKMGTLSISVNHNHTKFEQRNLPFVCVKYNMSIVANGNNVMERWVVGSSSNVWFAFKRLLLLLGLILALYRHIQAYVQHDIHVLAINRN